MRYVRTLLVLGFALVATACASPTAPEADDDGGSIIVSGGMQPNYDDGGSIILSGG